MRLLSWNVNGLRAVMKKGFAQFLEQSAFDVLCLQETKCGPGQVPTELLHSPDFVSYWAQAERKGYSGVGVLSKRPPIAVTTGIGIPRFDSEGRVLLVEFPDLCLANVYFPNGQSGDERLRYKLDFYAALFERLAGWKERTKKPLLICGDYNTAHNEIDLARPAENSGVSGFLPVERAWLDRIVAMGYTDTFRSLNPETAAYSWWSYRTFARERNIGWRLDYWFADMQALALVRKSFILDDIQGSDHCPVGVDLALP
jgi:exodeoxyribonuclease-3